MCTCLPVLNKLRHAGLDINGPSNVFLATVVSRATYSLPAFRYIEWPIGPVRHRSSSYPVSQARKWQLADKDCTV